MFGVVQEPNPEKIFSIQEELHVVVGVIHWGQHFEDRNKLKYKNKSVETFVHNSHVFM